MLLECCAKRQRSHRTSTSFMHSRLNSRKKLIVSKRTRKHSTQSFALLRTCLTTVVTMEKDRVTTDASQHRRLPDMLRRRWEFVQNHATTSLCFVARPIAISDSCRLLLDLVISTTGCFCVCRQRWHAAVRKLCQQSGEKSALDVELLLSSPEVSGRGPNYGQSSDRLPHNSRIQQLDRQQCFKNEECH